MLEHGGKVRAAAARFGIPVSNWLDLSTGVNPHGWPVPDMPASAWQHLPEAGDGLEAAAMRYYDTAHVLPVAGSQAALSALPLLHAPCRVGMRFPAYAEHAQAWRRAGHTVDHVDASGLAQAADDFDVLLLINPNNPTGDFYSPVMLLDLHARLTAHGGWLIVDEAFIDATPEASLAAFSDRPGLIVLRSLGKFFGLPGARVGFALAEAQFLSRLAEALGPWTVSGPARWAATLALQDLGWHYAARARLTADSRRLGALLHANGLHPSGGCALFQWVRTSSAPALYEAFAECGILLRQFTEPASLRFGLPGSEAEWARLERAFAEIGQPA